MPPKPSSSRSTPPASIDLPNHYEPLLPYPPVKSKDPHFFTNRYLLPGRSPILKPTFKKFKPIPDSPPNEGEVHGCCIESESNLIAKAARRLAAREAERNAMGGASEAGREREVGPGESVSSVGITRRRTGGRVSELRVGEASGSGSQAGSGGGAEAPRRRANRRATAPAEAPAMEQRNGSPERMQETPVEVLMAIQNYGMEPSAAVLARLGMSRELYRVVFDMHVAPDSILRRRR